MASLLSTIAGGAHDTTAASPSSMMTMMTIQPDPHSPVRIPSDHDVLSGRGGRINSHPGNVRFRSLVDQHKREYLDPRTKKADKARIAASIVRAVRGHRGKFLKEHPVGGGAWFEIGDERALKKTGQALRESAPELRAEREMMLLLANNGGTTRDSGSSGSNHGGGGGNGGVAATVGGRAGSVFDESGGSGGEGATRRRRMGGQQQRIQQRRPAADPPGPRHRPSPPVREGLSKIQNTSAKVVIGADGTGEEEEKKKKKNPKTSIRGGRGSGGGGGGVDEMTLAQMRQQYYQMQMLQAEQQRRVKELQKLQLLQQQRIGVGGGSYDGDGGGDNGGNNIYDAYGRGQSWGSGNSSNNSNGHNHHHRQQQQQSPLQQPQLLQQHFSQYQQYPSPQSGQSRQQPQQQQQQQPQQSYHDRAFDREFIPPQSCDKTVSTISSFGQSMMDMSSLGGFSWNIHNNSNYGRDNNTMSSLTLGLGGGWDEINGDDEDNVNSNVHKSRGDQAAAGGGTSGVGGMSSLERKLEKKKEMYYRQQQLQEMQVRQQQQQHQLQMTMQEQLRKQMQYADSPQPQPQTQQEEQQMGRMMMPQQQPSSPSAEEQQTMHQMLMTMMMYKNNDNSGKANSNNSNNAASSYVPSSDDTKNDNVSSSRRDSIVEFASMDASELPFAKLVKKEGGEEAEDWGLSEMGMTISSDMFSVVGTKDGVPLPEPSMKAGCGGGGGGGGVLAGLPTSNTLVDISPPVNDEAAAVAAPHGKNSLALSDTPSGNGGGGGGGGNSSTWLQQREQRLEGTPHSSKWATPPRTPKNFSMDENAFNESFKSMDMEDRPSSRKWTPARTAAGGGGRTTGGEQPPQERPDPDGVVGGAFNNSATANRSHSTARNKPYRRGTVDSIESLNLGDLMQSSGGILVDSSMGIIHNMPSNLDLGISLTSLMSFQSVKSEKNDDKSNYWLNQYNAIDSIVFESGDNQHNNPWEEDV